MKYLFMCIFALLGLASIATWKMLPATKTDVPVVYWVTDPNPARIEQVAIFQRWLKKDPNRPAMKVLVDAANNRTEKKVIQGVSGVGGDTMDIGGGAGMRYFNAIGLLEPVTSYAKKLGYDANSTYKAIQPSITQDGEQYLYPCNVAVRMLWVDYNLFDDLGVERPPLRWDFETFERIGKAYVAKANPPGKKQMNFMVNSVTSSQLYRSQGLSTFNETLTRCTLTDERYIKSLDLKYKWTYKDHIIPTPSEISGFDVESGYGGPTLYLFAQGNYAMFEMGRYALIRLRELQQERITNGKPMMKLGVLEVPNGGFPVTRVATRALGVYSGMRQRGDMEQLNRAITFQSYLASEDYNMQVVRDADALPPNPKYTKTAAYEKPLPLLPTDTELIFKYAENEKAIYSDFRIDFYEALDQIDRDKKWSIQDLPRPPKPALMSDEIYAAGLEKFDTLYNASLPVYRTEWGLHERFLDMLENIAIPDELTPFAVPETVRRLITDAEDEFMNDRKTALKAATIATNSVNAEIDRTLEEDPKIKPVYDKLMADQKIIDQLKKDGKPIPAKLVKNPFYLRYYRSKGMLQEEK